ncbi:MAG: arylsulfatase [Chthoniobacter sp.]|jgi:arylsulfatase A-like enzyme/spermidine synthase|nr:arylsulfatase [Chthoniobacter sp.]
MSRDFEELDYRQTPLGALSLRRRRILSLDGLEVFEVKLGEAFLMSSLFHEVEVALANLGLAGLKADALDVVVGGLGLGYTALATLEHPAVRSLVVVEALEAVIEWHRQGLVPLGAKLTADPRCRLVHGDFFALAASSGFDPANPGRRFHAVLLDIDHSPRHLLHPRHGAFYEPDGLRALAAHLHPGGVFALWSDDPPDDAFLDSLAAVFATSQAHVITFPNPLLECESASTVYVARKATEGLNWFLSPHDKMKRLLPSLHFCLLAALAFLSASSLAADQPNIVLFFVDDLGYGDIGPFGSTKNRTPNLDRMAREGMKLTSFYAAPVCTPSRAQVLTGCYAKRVSLPNVIFPAAAIGLNPAEPTVAKLLKTAGYATICIGKWHLGDQVEFLPTRHGFDQYFGLPYSNDMGASERPAAAGAKRDLRPPLPLLRDEKVIETVSASQQDRLTERYTDEAVSFIRAHAEAPFFLYLPHSAVHVPLHPGAKFRGQSANGTYGDWVEEVDWSIGRVLDTLRELKLAERTLVVFTSDNGPWLTQGKSGGTAGPLRGGKGGTFEGGLREPTIAWWPGKVPAGSVCDAVAGNIDFLPTFAALAGATNPSKTRMDGKDITLLLLGQSKESPRVAQYYFSGDRLEAVRSGPWKLAIGPQAENTGEAKHLDTPTQPAAAFTPKLYNLDTDLAEKTDVAAQHPEEVERLSRFVKEMDADLGVTTKGPGVRPPGRVEHPVGLYLPGHQPKEEPAPVTPPLDELKVGDTIPSANAPQIADKALTITFTVQSDERSGVILAHGGVTNGYALHLREGRLVFTVRIAGKPVAITADDTPPGPLAIEARLTCDGSMSLSIGGKAVATGKTGGLIQVQPAEDFCVGHDNAQTVGDYNGKALFQGSITRLKIVTESCQP